MDLVTADDVVWLSEERGGFRASLFLPTHRAGPRITRNRIRLKNLLQLARRTLRDDGVPAAAIDTAFQPAEEFVEDRWSSHRPSDGLAVFLGPEEFYPPNRDDQSDRAAVETLRNGGNVHALPAARMPSGSPVAATFRY